ncbi:hypothetical protein [Lysobacter gummosus]|uniref:hypothetical protein n=1 Tax=Lysobacter gummosus TaxID=262324 RepID=UPI00362B8C57
MRHRGSRLMEGGRSLRGWDGYLDCRSSRFGDTQSRIAVPGKRVAYSCPHMRQPEFVDCR